MPVSCCMYGCTNNSGNKSKSSVRYFRIPVVITREGKQTEELTRDRRLAWIKAINRKGLTAAEVDKKSWLRVCSEHFHEGKPAYRYLRNHPDWAPSLKLGYQCYKDVDLSRYARLKNRKRKKPEDNSTISNEEPQESGLGRETNRNNQESNNVNEAEVDRQNNENEKETNMYNDNDKGTNTDITIALVNAMESEVNRLSTAVIDAKSTLKELTYNKHFFENNDERVKSYTGLPTFAILWQLALFLCPSLGQTTSINPFQRVILVLFKLKLNMPNQVLGDMFHISSSTVSKIFLETLDVMYINLKQLIVWPERENLRKTMPKEFIKVYGRKVTIIIDCFEIFIEKPSSVKSQAETFSSYKHHNTAKYLIGVTPQATVSFLSKGWGGRTSDKHVTENSGFLDNLQHGDLILADRGFDISESVALKHAEVKIPAFTKGRKQLPASEIIATRKLARLRIHVERVIGSARNKYSILQSTIPITFLQSRDDDDCVTLDKIVTVCFSLLNLCPALVK